MVSFKNFEGGALHHIPDMDLWVIGGFPRSNYKLHGMCAQT